VLRRRNVKNISIARPTPCHGRIVRDRRAPGFTLVELLVVVAILTLLLSILLAALNGARGAARAVACQSNLKQINLAWSMYMDQSDGRMPYTRQSYLRPNWMGALDTIINTEPSMLDQVNTYSHCPQIRALYETSVSDNQWGYAINTWWDNIRGEHSDLKSWYRIRRPMEYPVFTDPELAMRDFGIRPAERVPRKQVASGHFGAPHWGVGPIHGAEDRANVAFADGSVRSVPIAEVNQGSSGEGDWPWFANIK